MPDRDGFPEVGEQVRFEYVPYEALGRKLRRELKAHWKRHPPPRPEAVEFIAYLGEIKGSHTYRCTAPPNEKAPPRNISA